MPLLTQACGNVAGDLSFEDVNGILYERNSLKHGLPIPDVISGINTIYSNAKLILVVEKDISGVRYSIGPRPLHINHWARNAQYIDKKFFTCPKRKVKNRKYGLFDLNLDGIAIMLTYKYGSIAMSYDDMSLAVPDLRWIGVCPIDVSDHDLKSKTSELGPLGLGKVKQLMQRKGVEEKADILFQLRLKGKRREVAQIEALSPYILN